MQLLSTNYNCINLARATVKFTSHKTFLLEYSLVLAHNRQASKSLIELLESIAVLAALPVDLPTCLTHPELLVQLLDVERHLTGISWQLISWDWPAHTTRHERCLKAHM